MRLFYTYGQRFKTLEKYGNGRKVGYFYSILLQFQNMHRNKPLIRLSFWNFSY